MQINQKRFKILVNDNYANCVYLILIARKDPTIAGRLAQLVKLLKLIKIVLIVRAFV